MEKIIKVTFRPDGSFAIESNCIGETVLAYGLLEFAKDQVRNASQAKPMSPLLAGIRSAHVPKNGEG